MGSEFVSGQLSTGRTTQLQPKYGVSCHCSGRPDAQIRIFLLADRPLCWRGAWTLCVCVCVCVSVCVCICEMIRAVTKQLDGQGWQPTGRSHRLLFPDQTTRRPRRQMKAPLPVPPQLLTITPQLRIEEHTPNMVTQRESGDTLTCPQGRMRVVARAWTGP
ncbi:hypothetical protein ABVT39_020679 [Epinephelus coioides]